MTRFTLLLLALLATTTFAATLPENLIEKDDDFDDDDFHRPSHPLKPMRTPCATPLITAIPIRGELTAESSAAPIMDPLATPESSSAPLDPFIDPLVTPEPSTAAVDPMIEESGTESSSPSQFSGALVTPEPSIAAVDPMLQEPDTETASPAPLSDMLETPEPSSAAMDPMVSESDVAISTAAPEPSTAAADPMVFPSSGTEGGIVTPKPIATSSDKPRHYHASPSLHTKDIRVPDAHAHGSHWPHPKRCFLQNVNFGFGTAERCCEERFACGSPECAHAHACENPDVCFCRKRICRKVYIKLSYTDKVDDECSKHLVNHF